MSNRYAMSETVSRRLARTQPLLIDGDWRDAEHNALSDIYNPSSAGIIGKAASASIADTELAIAAAR